jgi:tyrosyl-tRNA synthetase
MADLSLLTRGTVDLVSEKELADKLANGRPLRVKFGVDPTSPDLHFGHTVPLRKLRAFQDMGHTAVLIIGDFTTRVGDPSGRDSTRPSLTQKEIEANAETYKAQAFTVLDKSKTEVRYNSEWLEPFMEKDLLGTLRKHTVQQILAREDFAKRMQENSSITLLELLYPILQGQDSVAIKADVELGGGDQLFNLLMGREMQKDAGQEPQVVITVPLLVGLDGQKKMSKSYGNTIGVTESARDMFGKVMKVSDELMVDFYTLLTDENLDKMKALHPMEAKKGLAQRLTGDFHGAQAGQAERTFFDETFSKKKAPSDVQELVLANGESTLTWSQYLTKIGAVKSRKEATRLIAQGGVKINDEKLATDGPLEAHSAAQPLQLKVGKHKFYRVRFAS